MKSAKKISFVICAAVICAMMFTITAAASTVVVDFSKNDFVMGGISNAESDYINDDGKRVLFVHVTDGFDPDEDDPGSIKGDPNGGIEDFESYGVDGDVHKYMAASIKNESGAPFFEIHFASPSSRYAVATSVNFGIEPNSGYTKYVWNIEEWYERYYPKRDADHPQGGTSDPFFNHWSGIIDQLRLDFMYYTEPGGQARTDDKIYLEYIAFFETEAAANDFPFTPARPPDSIEADRIAREEAAAEAAANAPEPEAAVDETPAETPAGDDGEAEDAEEDAGTDGENSEDTGSGSQESSSGDDDEGGLNPVIIVVIIAAVVVIGVIIAVLAKKKK
ncbi:MAG: hypothetical protein FWH24_05675 [Oscillospiraceae bacterium]|nr:hypothetical protein [Oscillospiraceae bacterium]